MIVGKKKKTKSQYMVSHPKTGSDSPIGSDQDRGRDIMSVLENSTFAILTEAALTSHSHR